MGVVAASRDRNLALVGPPTGDVVCSIYNARMLKHWYGSQFPPTNPNVRI
jgi:hypothetical protein